LASPTARPERRSNQQWPEGAFLIGDPATVASKMRDASDTLGGVSGITFQLSSASVETAAMKCSDRVARNGSGSDYPGYEVMCVTSATFAQIPHTCSVLFAAVLPSYGKSRKPETLVSSNSLMSKVL
jgi:hypothetical protein